jgi:ferredoxin
MNPEMRTTTATRARARADVYAALAHAMTAPTPQLPGQLRHAAQRGADVLASPACAKAAHALTAMPAVDGPALRRQFGRITSPPGRRPPAFHESLQREGRLMGASTRAVEATYRRHSIAVDGGELPDHASVELTFLATLAEAEATARECPDPRLVGQVRLAARRFLREHVAAWMPAPAQAMAASAAPFYAVVGTWLHEFLAEEQQPRHAARTARRLHPALATADDCTLCGLCIGRCAPGALRMQEDDRHTALVFAPDRCTGCAQCVAVCPPQALAMTRDVAPDRDGGTWGNVTWRAASRLACPCCGRPTVSTAEMDAVRRALPDLDGDSLARLAWCTRCKSRA